MSAGEAGAALAPPPEAARAVDVDPDETQDWLGAVRDLLRHRGPDRVDEILEGVIAQARAGGAPVLQSLTTPYVNTIPADDEPAMPGDSAIERRLRSLVRWNAAAMVVRANRQHPELGGHIATYQSAATLYEVGFNHFWRAPTEEHGGDLIYIQGHSSPGIYARAFLEGRISEEQMLGFRQEVDGEGLSSYPHPWLMPEFWQFPTVSMGLGAIMAIAQARFLRYLDAREIRPTQGRKVWAFMGDGEMDEPESTGAIALAGRERLDNLIFVVNCNLQRLDGPVRGNGKIIQELEAVFRGAGWNVIKAVWGRRWDPLLAGDADGVLRRRMEECVDGDYQAFKSRDGAFVREHFFGPDPRLKSMVAHLTDEEIWALNRGGHDPQTVHDAYGAAVRHLGQPTVILAKTVKGFGMGRAGEARNVTHQQKKMDDDALLAFRDRFGVPLTDAQARDAVLYRPADDSPEIRYLRERRAALGGSLPLRVSAAPPLRVPSLSAFEALLGGTGPRAISTTMALVRLLGTLVRDREIGRHVVPIVPDESRTFGMEGMFRQLGIFSPAGQRYRPEDADQLMFYREDAKGQILQEGINEAGAFSSWIAAATSYANSGAAMVPFYLFYSMFGFQRIGDLAWAAGDSRARGFLIGGTAGRTTLSGEGLQHQDGHSHLLASTIPNCRAYDPTFAYELAVIVQDALRRMVADQEDVFFYLTVMNENYPHPPLPEGAEDGILRGMYPVRAAEGDGPRVQLMGSGAILLEALAAADLLLEDHGVGADVWSVTSFTELRREGLEVERWNRLHPAEPRRETFVEGQLSGREGPVIAVTDYMRALPDGIRSFVPAPYHVLGTDGFGRSDRRARLRRFFEVDRTHIAVAALAALSAVDAVEPATVAQAIARYGIDPEAAPPWQR